jgi:hypothetical protein
MTVSSSMKKETASLSLTSIGPVGPGEDVGEAPGPDLGLDFFPGLHCAHPVLELPLCTGAEEC